MFVGLQLEQVLLEQVLPEQVRLEQVQPGLVQLGLVQLGLTQLEPMALMLPAQVGQLEVQLLVVVAMVGEPYLAPFLHVFVIVVVGGRLH